MSKVLAVTATQLNTPIQAVLFDLDGTLVDTAPDLAAALNQLLTATGKSTLPYPLIREQASNGANALVELGFGLKVGAPGQAELRQRLLDNYQAEIAANSQLFAGLDELINELDLSAFPWGIVTNKPRLYTDLLLEKLALSTQVVVCPEDLGVSKPDPAPLLLAAQQLGIAAADCLYVGDHQRDILAGNRAGMRTLVAGFGYVSPGEDPHSWGADFIAKSVTEHNTLVRQLIAS